MSADQLIVVAIATGCVVVVGFGGQVLIRRLHGRGLATLLVAISVVVLAAVGAAVAVDSRVMFLSTHDGLVVALTLAAALPLACGLAIWLARAVSDAADSLATTAGQVGGTEPPRAARMVSSELASVQDQLLAADSALRAARQGEQAAETSRRELVAWVSHDLRTPLAGIRAMAEALEDGVLDDPSEYHKRLRIESDRLSEMVDTLFLLSRLHAGALPPHPEQMNLRDLVSDAVASVAPVAEVRKVSVTGDVDPGLVACVDPSQISRALTNLLINGVHHTPARGEVSVHAEQLADGVRISVQDACGGIAPEELPRVFDLAWRGRSARFSGPDGGGGLGLAVTQGIVAAHGGQVTVTNLPPGCRFDITLPGAATPKSQDCAVR
jgi:signal transduction histidine kinase